VRRLPIRWRLTLFFTVTLTVITLALIIAMFAIQGVMQLDQLQSRVRECAWAGESVYRGQGEISPGAVLLSTCDGITIAAVDADGRILSQTGYAGEIGSVHPDRIWRDVLRTENMQSWDARSDASDDNRTVVAVPVDDEVSDARVVIASVSPSAIGEEQIGMVPVVVAGAGIVVLIAMSIASWMLVRSSLAPVTAITSTAREITASDLSRRLPVVNSRDELGQLSTTINDLLSRFEVAFNQREQALEYQRRFVADASHELRTPLTSILGYTRMLRSWGIDNPDIAREGIDAVEREAERMHVLVESLLAIARGDELPAMHAVRLDLGELTCETVRSFETAEPGVEFRVDVPEEPVMIMADQVMIRQLTGILLDNAIKYGGASTSQPIEVTVNATEDAATLSIRDHGRGIPAQHLPHLFDRFYRADSSRGASGSGLGLAIAKQIVERHGGTIDVTSQTGEGTTFTVRLPRDSEPSTS
jgi:two-component system OmpR family sensor kinase